MRRTLFALGAGLVAGLVAFGALAGEAEVKSAQDTIDRQLKAFQSGDRDAAYSFASPTIKQIFPTADIFMGMVERQYTPLAKPRSYDFGKFQESTPTSIVQQVLIVGPDGKDYEAVYTLELQPDGVWRVTGVSMRAASTLST